MRGALALAAAAVLSLASMQTLAQGDPVAGREKAQQCAQCHGETGVSPSPQFPILAGQYADYLRKALEDYKSGARQNAIMAGFAANLSAQDQADLAAYYARQKSPLRIIERR